MIGTGISGLPAQDYPGFARKPEGFRAARCF
jgi:hypothetical protein